MSECKHYFVVDRCKYCDISYPMYATQLEKRNAALEAALEELVNCDCWDTAFHHVDKRMGIESGWYVPCVSVREIAEEHLTD